MRTLPPDDVSMARWHAPARQPHRKPARPGASGAVPGASGAGPRSPRLARPAAPCHPSGIPESRLPFRPALLLLALALPAAAQQSPDFPKGDSYIVQLTSSQAASGLGEYLVPPLVKAFRKAGMVYEGGPGARYAATVESRSDVGSWHRSGDGRLWLYARRVSVGLSPADVDIEPGGKLSPSFAVTARILTPDADRVDEFDCLVALAARALAAHYRPAGHLTVDGAGCARK